jgi:hypothetical protein
MRTLPCVAGIAVLVATLGCGSPTSDGGSGPSASGSGDRSTSAPTPAASSTTPTPTAGTLTGYGALREDWNSSHRQAPGMTPGAAFLPMVNGDQPKYAAVSGDPGERILSYEIYFEDGTSLETAKRIVLQEFPAEAKFGVEDNDEVHCLIVDVRSASVERVMEGYRPIVGFFSRSEILDRSQVHNASMLIAGPEEKTDLGMC